jgi:predicted nucleic acid-binding protein
MTKHEWARNLYEIALMLVTRRPSNKELARSLQIEEVIKVGIDLRAGIIYNTNLKKQQIVADTNVFVTALRSQFGASYKLLSLIDKDVYQLNLSVPLVLEYEEVAKRMIGEISLTEQEIDDILDFVIKHSNRWSIFYLWRPQLKDPSDDMVLELAVTASCNSILTYNINDFKGIEKFGIKAITPKAFLELVGEL